MTLLRTLPKRLSLLLLATAVAFGPILPARLHAADQDKKFRLLFSDKANDAAPRAALPLRPTVQQKFFVYVQNTTPQKETVTVDVLAGGAPVDGTLQTIDIDAGTVVQVMFGKPPAPPPPAVPAPAGEKPAPAPKPQPPALEEAKGPLQVRVLDKEHKEVFDAADLQVARPLDYITIDPKQISYDPKPQNGKKNELTIRVKASDNFIGPKCRIDLVLRPDRIPGLIDSQRKDGTRGGYLTKPGGELVLTADNLEFQEGVERKNGLVYLTIDGYERAFTFSTTFPADEGQEGKPAPVNTPIVRLDAAPTVNPGAPYPVGLEVDNAVGAELELGFDRNNDGKFLEDNDEILKFAGARKVRMLASAAGPGGCLLLQPEVQDWKAELDAGAVFGRRTLRVRLLDAGNAELSFIDARRATLDATPGEPVTKIEQTVMLDGSPPEGVKFVDLPPTLPRGAELPVKAVGLDPDSDIKEVVFYLGKPGPDGAAPPMAVKTPGKLIDTAKNLWGAALTAPTDQKGKLDVTVQFTNGANLTASDPVTIQLVDPTPPGGAPAVKGGSVEGVVVEGGRGQPGLEVRLLDDKGMVKDTTKTDDKGKYLFKDLAAGTYKVSAAKTTDSTKGETGVQIVDGVKKIGVDVKLTR